MAVTDPRLGMSLGERYLLRERIAEGSMGVVYRGERLGLGRAVAIKFLNESYAATEDGMRRFDVEARAMSRLNHPNCVAVTDYGVDGAMPYVVMDFITGLTLRQVMLGEGPLSPTRSVRIACQVLAGLAHAHGHHIIHRDVKPENILISAGEGAGGHEQVRILDFGLAKLRNEASVTSGLALGTPTYMSPEQTAGAKVDERSDVYAVGVVLYELLSGRKPFQHESPFELMRLHREAAVPPLTSAVPGVGVSDALRAVVGRALAKTREARYQTAQEMREALEATPEGRGRRRDLRRRTGLVAAIVGVALLAALAWWLSRPAGRPAVEDRAAAIAPPAAVAPIAVAPRPDEAPDVARLRATAVDDPDAAIRELEALRRAEPRRADVHLALGRLYADQGARRSSVVSYGAALVVDPSAADTPRLIEDLVLALGDPDAHEQAAALLTDKIGEIALPQLTAAAASPDETLRRRAAALSQRLAVDRPTALPDDRPDGAGE